MYLCTVLSLCTALLQASDFDECGSWFAACQRCDLAALQSFNLSLAHCIGADDESCLTYCLASSTVSRELKMTTLDWLLDEAGVEISNETFHHVCRDAFARRQEEGFDWEYFPLTVLNRVSANSGFDYEEALCHAAFHGCSHTVQALLTLVHAVNFEKILPECQWKETADGGKPEQVVQFVPTTPLVQAVLGGHVQVVRILVERGWSAEEYQAGCNPVQLAVRGGRPEMAAFLIRIGGVICDADLLGASESMRAAAEEAIAYRKDLVQAAASRIKFYSDTCQADTAFEKLYPATRMMIEDQLLDLKYSQLEIKSVLYNTHQYHY